MQWILLIFFYCWIGAYNFLEDDNFVVLQSKNYPSRSIGVKNGDNDEVWIEEAQKFPSGQFKFREVKGLAVKNTELNQQTENIASFQFGSNFYLRHSNFDLYLHKLPDNENVLFNQDASFVIRELEGKYKGYVQLESFNYPGHFIRHEMHPSEDRRREDRRVKIAKADGDAFKEDSSFLRIASREVKGVNIQIPLSRCYVGVDLSNEPLIPHMVSKKSAALFRMVRGLSGGYIDIVSFAFAKTEFNIQYLQHDTGSDNKKLIVADVPFEDKAAASFKVNSDNSEYKAFLSLDVRSHFIHSDGKNLTLQLIGNIQDNTAKENSAIYFTFNDGRNEPAGVGEIGTLATLDSIHYIGIDELQQAWLFNVPTTLQIVPGLAGEGTVSFKGKLATFLVYGGSIRINGEIIYDVIFKEDSGESYKTAASWYLEEIKRNHEYVFLRSHDSSEYYMHSSCDGLTLRKKSTSTEEGGFYFKINPNTQQDKEN